MENTDTLFEYILDYEKGMSNRLMLKYVLGEVTNTLGYNLNIPPSLFKLDMNEEYFILLHESEEISVREEQVFGSVTRVLHEVVIGDLSQDYMDELNNMLDYYIETMND